MSTNISMHKETLTLTNARRYTYVATATASMWARTLCYLLDSRYPPLTLWSCDVSGHFHSGLCAVLGAVLQTKDGDLRVSSLGHRNRLDVAFRLRDVHSHLHDLQNAHHPGYISSGMTLYLFMWEEGPCSGPCRPLTLFQQVVQLELVCTRVSLSSASGVSYLC